MSNEQFPQVSEPRGERGSLREGTIITGRGLSFEIPRAWVRWHEENGDAHPNLHLTASALDAVKDTEGDFDSEFAEVVNAVLPFEGCIAHVGGDGWGPGGVSFADLQVRAFVLTETPAEIETRARNAGAATVAAFTSAPSVPRQERAGAWSRTVFDYFRWYGDYGATASVDLRLRRFNEHTVGFAFMYTDHASHDAEIDALLDSVTFGGE